MSELIGFTNTWFLNTSVDQLEILTNIVNKAYDKARLKYNVIRTCRVKNPTTFLSDFEISKEKPFILFLLLGPEEKFKVLEQEGILRDFLTVSETIEDAYSCDIPDKYVENLKLSRNQVSVKIISDHSYKLTASQTRRVLGTIGYKNLKDEKHFIKDLELTSFTSFARLIGSNLFDIASQRLFKSSVPDFDSLFGIDRTSLKGFKINSLVIKEHDLVKYYITKCQFVQSSNSDLLFEVDEEGRITGDKMEDGIFANRNFHLAFLHREIQCN